jgi:formylmethanofuran dehydrogenase subunit C
VNADGSFITAGPLAYNVMAGGSYTTNNNTVITGTGSTTLKPPTGSAQSLGIWINGKISGFTPTTAPRVGGVGLLSDYFDQARQYALTVEAQSGMGTAGLAMHNDTAAPLAPLAPSTTVASTKFTPANLTTAYLSSIGATYTAATKTYAFSTPIKVTGNLALSTSGGSAFPAGTVFNFSTLYVTSGTFTVTGDLDVNASTLYVNGALTISGDTTSNTDDLGTAYVTGATSISGRTGLTLNSAATSYFGSTFNHTPSTAVTDNLGPLYFVGNATFSSSSGAITIAGGKNVHAGGTFTITGPTSSSSSVPCVFGSLYSVGAISITGNAIMDTTDLYTGGGFSLQGNTASFTDQFGPVYVAGTADWNCGSTSARLRIETTSATASVPATTWIDPATPAPMFAQIFNIDGDTNGNYDSSSGPYDVVLGDVWVDGNAGTGDVAVNFSAPSSGTASTIMCPLLATTEKTCTNGYINIGTLTDPMVYFMQCDNDGLYSNTCEWASTGTFTGIAIIMESDIEVTGGNNGASWQTANFVGSLMAGCPVTPDITMSSNSSVCYNQKVVENLPANLQSILRTTTTTTVPGTWQQLPSN